MRFPELALLKDSNCRCVCECENAFYSRHKLFFFPNQTAKIPLSCRLAVFYCVTQAKWLCELNKVKANHKPDIGKNLTNHTTFMLVCAVQLHYGKIANDILILPNSSIVISRSYFVAKSQTACFSDIPIRFSIVNNEQSLNVFCKNFSLRLIYIGVIHISMLLYR